MDNPKRELSKAQREFILERDGHRCQFHTYYKGRGLVRCPNTSNLHVHHIKPHRYLAQVFKIVIETPYNLITLCKDHHFGHIHPDMREALRNYARDKDAISKVFLKRKDLISQNIPYWVQRWDDFLKWLAREATNAYNKSWPK
jgi:hypothetical protein